MSQPKSENEKRVRRALYLLAILSMGFAIFETIIALPRIPPPVSADGLGVYFQDSIKNIAYAALGVIGAVFFSVIGITWDMNLWIERVSHTLKQMVTHFDNVVECRYFGLGSQTLVQILDRLELAQSVRNTFVLFGISESDAYDDKQFGEVRTRVGRFLKRGGNWTDIISQDVINSPTTSWLSLTKSLQEELENPELSTDAKAAMDRYGIRHLKGIYPLINFIILQYGDGREEVIFGWGHHAEEPGGRVFLSTNRRLIGTFDRYWRMLEKDSMPIRAQARPIIATEITGLWFRVAYYVDYDWKARAGIPLDAQNGPYDMALVNISLKENRNLAIEGRRFKFESTLLTEKASEKPTTATKSRIKRVNSFDSKAADLEGNRLWFSTTSASDEKLHIAGWYRFIQEAKQKKVGETRFDRFYGEFVEYQDAPEIKSSTTAPSSFKYKVGRLVLFGIRVPPEWRNGISEFGRGQGSDTVSHLTEFPDTPQDQILLICRCLDWWNQFGMGTWQYGICEQADEPPSARHRNEL